MVFNSVLVMLHMDQIILCCSYYLVLCLYVLDRPFLSVGHALQSVGL